MRRTALILLALGGCGRIAFDAAGIVCPSTYVEIATGCYRFELDNADELPWLEAEAACESEGAHLAVVDDEDELALFTLTLTDVEDAWVGASDRVTPDKYITVTGEPFFVQWGNAEPNGTGDCIEVERGDMGDTDCTVKNDYICEVDGRRADPTSY